MTCYYIFKMPIRSEDNNLTLISKTPSIQVGMKSSFPLTIIPELTTNNNVFFKVNIKGICTLPSIGSVVNLKTIPMDSRTCDF